MSENNPSITPEAIIRNAGTLAQQTNQTSEYLADLDEQQELPLVDLKTPMLELGSILAEILAPRGIYRHAGKFIQINEDDPKNIAEEICPKVFVSWMQQFARVHNGYKKEKDGPGPPNFGDATTEKSSLILKSPTFFREIPEIRSIIPARLPIMTEDGPKLLQKGYNAEQKIYVLNTAPEIEDWDVSQAMEYYADTFASFPWGDDGRSMAAHASAMVGMFAQLLFPAACTIPLYQFTANMEGSGKSLLARSALAPIYGIQCSSSDYSETDKFTEILNSIAYSGQGFLFLDDLRGTIINQALNRWITDPTWQFRKYHSQSMVSVDKKCMTIMTDNGSTLWEDLVRRAVIIQLESEQRATEKQKGLAKVITNEWLAKDQTRSEMLSMLWAWVRHWHEKGQRKTEIVIPSLEMWTGTVGGIITEAGFSEPFSKAGLLNSGDKRRTEFDLLLSTAIEKYNIPAGQSQELKLPDLCEIAREKGIFESPLEDVEVIRILMDNNPRLYKELEYTDEKGAFCLGPPENEDAKNQQAMRYMDPKKHASPFSRRLKKMDKFRFTINEKQYQWRHTKGRTAAYTIQHLN